MPELPEVETVRRTLAPAVGMRVTEVWTSGKRLRGNQAVKRAELRRAAVGHRIEAVRRRGKYLLVDLAGSPTSILVHLGMSGRFRLMKSSEPRAPHTHVVLSLSGRAGKRELRYSDPRRFGQVSPVARAAEHEHPSLAGLGIDPLLDELTGEHLYASSRAVSRPAKVFVLDQRVIAGVGNIYASEALWLAQIHPMTRVARLSRKRADALAAAVKDVLERALGHGGTSLRDFVSADGRAGEHIHHLWVYDRAGEPCPRCGRAIVRTVVQGRSTFHCPACQKR